MKYVLSLFVLVCFSLNAEASVKELNPHIDEHDAPKYASLTRPTVDVYFQVILNSPDEEGTIIPETQKIFQREKIQFEEDGTFRVSNLFPGPLLTYIQQKLAGLDVLEPLSKNCSLPTQYSEDESTFVTFPLFTLPCAIVSEILTVWEEIKHFSE